MRDAPSPRAALVLHHLHQLGGTANIRELAYRTKLTPTETAQVLKRNGARPHPNTSPHGRLWTLDP